MKIQTNLHAGMNLQQCQRERDYWKAQAERMEAIAKGPAPRPNPYPPNPYPPQPTPQPPTPGGGWINGIWYADHSGWCG